MKIKPIILTLLALAAGFPLINASPLGPAFTYQDRLNDGGVPANGKWMNRDQWAVLVSSHATPTGLLYASKALAGFKAMAIRTSLFLPPPVTANMLTVLATGVIKCYRLKK